MSDENPMRSNLTALIVILLLVVGGLYLAQKLRQVGTLQDCVMSGRTNCAPIDTGH